MSDIKPIAIYLPQYHPIPENDEAWGEGFTEWTNVRKAKPLFEGHYQPHIPHNTIGYYNLLNPEVLVEQAELARKYGIYGFAFYHYWFNGKRLLNSPIDNMIELQKPDFPFMLIWANENWTKRWDGQDNEIIIKQEYSFEDDRSHMQFLCEQVFVDDRYIKIDGKPVFSVYRMELFPDIVETTRIWREVAQEMGFKDLYLIKVEGMSAGTYPEQAGFDAAMEFAPDWQSNDITRKRVVDDYEYSYVDYNKSVTNNLIKSISPYKTFKSVFPSWDNTARKKVGGLLYTDPSIETFEYFVSCIAEYTYRNFVKEERFFFINAWNEWGEGCHIEPDCRFGFKYLESVQVALERLNERMTYLSYLNMLVFILRKRISIDKGNDLINESGLYYLKLAVKVTIRKSKWLSSIRNILLRYTR